MRLLPLLSLLFLLAEATSSHAGNPASAIPPNIVSVPNLFQYTPPAGWQIANIPNGQFPAAEDKQAGEVKGLITVDMDTSASPLDEWCKNCLEKNTRVFADYSPVFTGLRLFGTTAGISGYSSFLQLNIGGKKIHFIYYFFAGSNNARFAFTCTCSADSAAHYDPLFEKAAKTFTPY